MRDCSGSLSALHGTCKGQVEMQTLHSQEHKDFFALTPLDILGAPKGWREAGRRQIYGSLPRHWPMEMASLVGHSGGCIASVDGGAPGDTVSL